MQIPFGEWLPDQPEYLNPGANTANNVYFARQSYKRFPSLVAYSSNNIGADSRGAGSFRDNSNNVFNFVAKNTDIYQLRWWNIYIKKRKFDWWQHRLFYFYTIRSICCC